MKGLSRNLAVAMLAVVVAAGAFSLLSERADGLPGPLDRYIVKPDDSYRWTMRGRMRVGSSEVIELRLQSQIWRDTQWKHRLFLLVPERIATGGHVLLIIGGGRWRASYDTVNDPPTLPDDAREFIVIAEQLETLVAVVDNVPFQPLFDRTEDTLIAYTLDQYRSSGDPEWPLLLPMVKSVVRAMDAVSAAAAEHLGREVSSFTLLGGSKRGWTAWLAAAVDPRVTAIVPVVIDALSMDQHFPYQTQAWGAPSDAIRPYTERHLDEFLSSTDGRELREIIDPFSYRDRLVQPKLIVNATNDEYFPLDALNLYWDGLLGEKFALYLPNESHSTRDFARLIPALRAFHEHAAGLAPMPRLEWQYVEQADRARLCIHAEPEPTTVVVWTAVSEDRDFRDERWSAAPIGRPPSGPFVEEMLRPRTGYAALFAELRFAADGPRSFTLSTTPAILGAAGNDPSIHPPVDTAATCTESD